MPSVAPKVSEEFTAKPSTVDREKAGRSSGEEICSDRTLPKDCSIGILREMSSFAGR
jgi:hypothetical protein